MGCVSVDSFVADFVVALGVIWFEVRQ